VERGSDLWDLFANVQHSYPLSVISFPLRFRGPSPADPGKPMAQGRFTSPAPPREAFQ
jgi:hypothetical protein